MDEPLAVHTHERVDAAADRGNARRLVLTARGEHRHPIRVVARVVAVDELERIVRDHVVHRRRRRGTASLARRAAFLEIRDHLLQRCGAFGGVLAGAELAIRGEHRGVCIGVQRVESAYVLPHERLDCGAILQLSSERVVVGARGVREREQRRPGDDGTSGYA